MSAADWRIPLWEAVNRYATGNIVQKEKEVVIIEGLIRGLLGESRDGEPDYFLHPKRVFALEVALGDAAANLQACFREFDRQGLHGFAQYSLAWKEDAFKAYCACPRCVVREVECACHCDHGIYDPICPHCKEDQQ